MGLFPEHDSPHYHKAKVISLEEVKTLLDERVLNAVRNNVATTTGVRPLNKTNDDLRLLWGRIGDVYNFKVYINGSPAGIQGIRFTKDAELGRYRLIARIEPRFIEIIDLPLVIEDDGSISNIGDFRSVAFVKEGTFHKYNPSPISLVKILLSNASFGVDYLENTRTFFKLEHNNSFTIHYQNQYETNWIMRVPVKDTLSQKVYTFYAQVSPRQSRDKTWLPLIAEQFRINLPEYFTVDESLIRIHSFAGKVLDAIVGKDEDI